jgi:hypothetical protein
MPKLPSRQLRRIAEHLFTTVPGRSSATELVMICEQPGCSDQSGNRSVNLTTGMTNCWKCNKGGDFIAWATSIGHKPDVSNLELYDQRKLDDVSEELNALDVGKKSVVAFANSVKLPHGFTALSDEPNSGYAKLCARMAKRKNLDLATFMRAGAGFTRDDPYWEPFCIFPVIEWGKVVYYQGRTYTDRSPDPVTGKKPSTKQFPNRDTVKLGSRYWVYNIDRLRTRAKIGIVVESIFNVLSLENELGLDCDIVPIGVFKHKISDEQQAKILTAKKLEELVIMMDPDAVTAAWESCYKLTNLIKVTVAPPLPLGVDPNDDAKAAVQTFLNRRPFTVANDLERLASEL